MKQLEAHKSRKKLLIFVCSTILLLVTLVPSFAASANIIIPEENQYFELRAVEVKDVEGNKQVIMELWGHEIDFKRI